MKRSFYDGVVPCGNSIILAISSSISCSSLKISPSTTAILNRFSMMLSFISNYRAIIFLIAWRRIGSRKTVLFGLIKYAEQFEDFICIEKFLKVRISFSLTEPSALDILAAKPAMDCIQMKRRGLPVSAKLVLRGVYFIPEIQNRTQFKFGAQAAFQTE